MILQKIRNKGGFTLLELLVAIVIIFIAVVLLIPAVKNIINFGDEQPKELEVIKDEIDPYEDETMKPEEEEKL